MKDVVKIGVAGLGTVGAGTVKLLSEHRDLLTDRSGRQIVVTAVSARDRTRDRGFSTEGLTWYDDARDLAADKEIDILVELITWRCVEHVSLAKCNMNTFFDTGA